jgi:streptogramin lyase
MTALTSLRNHRQHRSPQATLNRDTEMHTMKSVTTNLNPKRGLHIARGIAASAPCLALAFALTGCSGGALPGNFGIGSTPTVRLMGTVMGGQQPVSGATIQLYTVGTTGPQSAATPLIGSSILTDAGGSFSITDQYSCASATQVYLVATGGNPGSGTNSTISMVAALGSCATLQANAATTFLIVNELSTVAAAYALAPFAADFTHVGATGSNPTGLVNAFASVNQLYTLPSGTAGGASLPAGASAPITELNTLGNIIAACVNTNGAGSTACTTLFTATGATESFGAALAMAKHPGTSATTGLYTLSSSTAPFQPSMSTQPKDFTVAMTYTAAGTLLSPYGVAIDAAGNAWIANESGTTVSELSTTGSLLASPTAIGLVGPQGIAVDPSGNVWVANTAGNSVVRFTIAAGLVSGNSSFTAGGITAPTAIAMDSAGNAFVSNFNGNSVTKLTSAGAAASGSPFTAGGLITLPSSLALDSSGNVFVSSSNGTAVKLTNAGAYVSTLTDKALQGSLAIAVDPANRVFLSGSTTGSQIAGALSEFSIDGTPSPISPAAPGAATALGVAADANSVWVIDTAGLAQMQYGVATPVSPASGYGSLNIPVAVALDASGNVWTTNSGSNTVSKFIGLATLVRTPLSANVGP